jgi:tetratricopeptide (TPR) repeat protein
MALGKKYTELKRWSDAERCLRKYVAVSTDHDGYEALAAVYEKQNQMDLWLATLKEFLARGQDYGLERAMVDQQIADYYMAKGDYKSALPYADAAAGTASAWGLLCAADAHTGLGDWTTAEQLIREEIDHYSASPFALFSWQMHTGHGDLAATRKALHDYYTSKGNNLTGDDLGEMGILEMVDNDDAAALGTFRRYFSQQPEMFMGDQVAVLADELQDGQTRDAALSQVVAMQPKDAPYLLFAAALRDAVKSGPKAVPDEKRMNAVLANTNVNGRVTICALAAHFAEHRGQPDAAVAILRKSAGAAGNCWNRPVLDAELRAHGMDPLEMARATTRPQ